MQLQKLEAMGAERAVAAINHSIMNGYQGIYEPKPDFAPSRPVRGAAPVQAQAPAVAGGPVTVAEWQAHWETVLAKGWVPCPLNFGTPESEGYYAAIERRSAAMKAAAAK